MATLSAARSKTATLVANSADQVTITGTIRKLQVVNFDTSSRISVTYNGVAATVDGDNTIPVPPGGTATLFDATETDENASVAIDETTDHVVSLKSAGTPTYCVVGF